MDKNWKETKRSDPVDSLWATKLLEERLLGQLAHVLDPRSAHRMAVLGPFLPLGELLWVHSGPNVCPPRVQKAPRLFVLWPGKVS